MTNVNEIPGTLDMTYLVTNKTNPLTERVTSDDKQGTPDNMLTNKIILMKSMTNPMTNKINLMRERVIQL